jgi:shikimate dehydrogenase
MKLYGLIGYPLGHSFSQKYFTEKFKQLGIEDCRYDAFSLENINNFPALLKNNPGLCGLNITIPHKQNIIPFLSEATQLPQGMNACNCIKIENGKLTGYNTDVIGFEQSLFPLLQQHHTKALVLGNGGAAEAVKFVLNKLGIAFKVVSRQLHNGSHLTYQQITKEVIATYNLIINTTPLGTYPKVEECPDVPYQYLTPQHYLFDLVYNPEKPLFLLKGEQQGASIKNGYDMLVIQAEESWKIWNS